MSAFAPWADQPWGEDAGDEPSNVVQLPAAFLALGAPAPAVAGGTRLAPPAPSLALAAAAPAVAGGARVNPPAAAPLALQTRIPAVLAGARVPLPAPSLTLIPLAPDIRTGARIALPVATLSLSAAAPQAAGGAQVAPPAAGLLMLEAFAPEVIAGNYVYIEAARSQQDDGGCYGDNAWAEFAYGEGPTLYREADGAVRLTLRAYAPDIQAGVYIALPAAVLALAMPIPENQARARPVAVQAIAS